MDGNLAITRTVFFLLLLFQKMCAVFRMRESNILSLTFPHPRVTEDLWSSTWAFRGPA